MTLPNAILGLDFGGSKLAAGLVTSGGAILAQQRRPTDISTGAEGTIAAMLELGRELQHTHPVQLLGVGVNFGGPVDAERGVVLTSRHVPGWHDTPLAARLQHQLGVPCVLENDANGQALAEWRYGAGQGSSQLVYLNVGTGIGGGLVTNGRLYRGAHGLAGELGHMVIQPHGPVCPCGRRGCLEALCAGPAMARRLRATLATVDPAMRGREPVVQLAGHWESASGAHLTAAAAADDPLALRVLDAIFADLALGLANIAALVDPDLLVLGGGAMGMPPALFERLRQRARHATLAELAPTLRLEQATLGAATGILGGAAAFLDRHTANP